MVNDNSRYTEIRNQVDLCRKVLKYMYTACLYGLVFAFAANILLYNITQTYHIVQQFNNLNDRTSLAVIRSRWISYPSVLTFGLNA